VQVAVVHTGNSTVNGSFIAKLWAIVSKAGLVPSQLLVVDSVQAAVEFIRNDSCLQTSGRIALAYAADASLDKTIRSLNLFPSDDVLLVPKRVPLEYLMFAEQLMTWNFPAFIGAVCALLLLCSLGVMLSERLSGSNSEYALADGCSAILGQWFSAGSDSRQPYSVAGRFFIGVSRFSGICILAVGFAVVVNAVLNVRDASSVSDPAQAAARVGMLSKATQMSLPLGFSSATTLCADATQCLEMLSAQQLSSAILPMSQLQGRTSDVRVVGPFKQQASATQTYRVLADAATEPWGSAAFAQLAKGLELARSSAGWERLRTEAFGGGEAAQPSSFWEARTVSAALSIVGGIALISLLCACCFPHCYAQLQRCKASSLQYLTNTVELCDWRTKAQLKQLANRLERSRDVAEIEHVQAALQRLKLRMQQVQSESTQWWRGEDGSWYEGANPTYL
jgi:hypothetical protein